MADIIYYDESQFELLQKGMYVCYINHEFIESVTDKILLMWDGDYFYHRGSDIRYRGYIYGAVGPLPCLKLEINK